MTLADPHTGEVVELDTPPTSLVQVVQRCDAIDAWAGRCDSVPELRDAGHRLEAIRQYLARTSVEGQARVAASERRLEMRIGELLGAATNAPRSGRSSVTNDDLSRNARRDFRTMAAHPEIVDDVITDSTDTDPASRRKVLRAIRGESKSQPPARVASIYVGMVLDLCREIERTVEEAGGPDVVARALAELPAGEDSGSVVREWARRFGATAALLSSIVPMEPGPAVRRVK